MKIVLHDHRDATIAVAQELVDDVAGAIGGISLRPEPNGQKHIRAEVLRLLDSLGWSGEVRVAPDLNITVTGMHGNVAACVQFGNVSRVYADLLKLQVLYERGRCDGALYIIPTKAAADQMASNLATLERMVRELELFKSIINVPIKIMGVE